MKNVIGLLHEIGQILVGLAFQIQAKQMHLVERDGMVSPSLIVANDDVHKNKKYSTDSTDPPVI